MTSLNFQTLDVFTTDRFAGNPLAVVLEADALSTEQMQTIAREFNLSETIFVRQPNNPQHTASVRIFFPTAEIPFAGHPTIGCAILLAEMQHPGTEDFATDIFLEEVAGLVPVRVWRERGIASARFTAPIIPTELEQPAVDTALLANAFGISTSEIGFSGHAPGHFEGGPKFYYVPLASREALSKARPGGVDWPAVKAATGNEAFYLYTVEGTGYSARMFAPDHGIFEDPATGSASAILAAQLLKAGELQDGTNAINLSQGCDMGRPSEIGLEVDVENGAIAAVRVSGSAVRVMEGIVRA